MRPLVLLSVLIAGCIAAPEPSPARCAPTIARMQPPQEFFDFVVAGSSQPERTRSALMANGNFYGNDALWVLLPSDGRALTGGDKFLTWRIKPGVVTYTARRTDLPGSEVTGTYDFGAAYGDRGFQPGGVDVPTDGCWEVTYRLNGADDLTFTVATRPR